MSGGDLLISIAIIHIYLLIFVVSYLKYCLPEKVYKQWQLVKSIFFNKPNYVTKKAAADAVD